MNDLKLKLIEWVLGMIVGNKSVMFNMAVTGTAIPTYPLQYFESGNTLVPAGVTFTSTSK